MPEYCEEQADCLKGIDIRDWPERCYACGHASAQAQAKETKSPQPATEADVRLNNLLSVKRFAYIKKLVSEIEEQVDVEMVDIDGDKCIPSKWINVSLLCSVIKEEILRT